jgi:membrane associated rhomboid family serine protease
MLCPQRKISVHRGLGGSAKKKKNAQLNKKKVFKYLIFLAIGSSVMSAVCNPDAISVGASGSLFGMLGCQMVI